MGKKRTGRVVTTISVPADLKRRMEKTKEDVNWSALACQAFEAKLAEIVTLKGVKTMDDVVQRLRASMQENEEQSYKDGFEKGEEWARHRAEAIELDRLERYRTGCGSDWGAICNTGQLDIYMITHPDQEIDDRDFWNDVFNDYEHSRKEETEWCRGFVDGTLQVWSEVKSRL